MNPTASLVVIIPSYNSKAHLEACLHSVLKQKSQTPFPVYVIDNCSTDGSADMVQLLFPGVQLIRNSFNFGFSYACNQGWQKSQEEILLYVNSDVILPPDAISKVAHKMKQRSEVGIVGVELRGENNELIQMSWGWTVSLAHELFHRLFSPALLKRMPFLKKIVEKLQARERDVPFVSGACFAVKRSIMSRLNGFDETFQLYFEDNDLCLRCRQSGARVVFTPDIKVIHSLGKSNNQDPLKPRLAYRQGQIRFYRKHRSKVECFILKIYLTLKYCVDPYFWRNKWYRFWIINIILEKRYFTLRQESEHKVSNSK